ncbi:Semaphorin-5B, partial [Bulinus truncatus]
MLSVMGTLAISQNVKRWTYEDIRPAKCLTQYESSDLRLISNETLAVNLSEYSHGNISQFVQMEIDNDNNQLLIGSREFIYRLSLDSFTLLQKEMWLSERETQKKCQLIGVKYCGNYIAVLKKSGNEVLVCGTNSIDGICQYRNATNIQSILRPMNEYSLCPYQPDQKTTALVASDLSVYSAAFTKDHREIPMIIHYRTNQTQDTMVGRENDSHWFNAPSFIASFELDGYVYIFFRETAKECSGCGKRIISRVARICRKDPGMEVRHFATYAKARLNCSLPGDVPFYFDYIQSVYLQKEEKQFYATFTSPPLTGSAVCVYNLSSIEKTFHGHYKYLKDFEVFDCNWITSDSRYNKTCNNPSPVTYVEHKHATLYHFKDQEVQPSLTGPLVISQEDTWSHIQVDRVWTKSGYHSVFFVSTNRGHIQKFTVNPKEKNACLVESIRVQEKGQEKFILEMKLSSDKNALYVAVEGKVLKIPTSRCWRHKQQ